MTTSLETGGKVKGELDTAAWGVSEMPELLFCCCVRLYISQVEIKICIKQREHGQKASWQFKKGGEMRELWGGEQRWGEREWDSGRSSCSDSSEAAEGEECTLFLPLQTSCPATSPCVVINTCYSPLSVFQSIDKTGVKPVRTMALSVAPSNVG